MGITLGHKYRWHATTEKKIQYTCTVNMVNANVVLIIV